MKYVSLAIILLVTVGTFSWMSHVRNEMPDTLAKMKEDTLSSERSINHAKAVKREMELNDIIHSMEDGK